MNPSLMGLMLLAAIPAAAPAAAFAAPQAPIPAATPVADSLKVGERLAVLVQGEPSLSDTFTVQPGPLITMPGIGDVPLAGVRRNEVAPYLTRYLSRYLRRPPQVQVTLLFRVAVLGEVERPGFYAIASDQPLADIMMRAGGPTRDALIKDAHIERGDHAVLAGDSLADLLATGVTAGAAGLTTGDRIVVPRIERADPETKFRILAILVTIPVAVYGIVKLF